MSEMQVTEVRLLGGEDWIHVETLCRLSGLRLEVLVELTELGVLAPRGDAPAEWQLPASSVVPLGTMGRLIRDLDVNASGAAIIVELLEARRRLEERIRELERRFG